MRGHTWSRCHIPNSVDFHIIPEGDIQEHSFFNCPCSPEVETEKRNGKTIARAIVHKAADGRPGPLLEEKS